MTNPLCCHCLVRGRPGSSFLLVFNQALTVQYSVFDKTQIKYLKHFNTINYFLRKQTSLAILQAEEEFYFVT